MLNKLFPKLLLLTFTGASLGTSTMAGLKVASHWNTESARESSGVIIDLLPTSTPAESELEKSPATPSPRPTTPQLPKSNTCVVTIFGEQFDVFPLKKTHQGGDIFICETDMTATYQKQHGTDLSRMAPYRLNISGQADTSSNLKRFSESESEEGENYEDD